MHWVLRFYLELGIFGGAPFDCTTTSFGPSTSGPGGGAGCTLLASCTNGTFIQNIELVGPFVAWYCENGTIGTGIVSGDVQSISEPFDDYMHNQALLYLYPASGFISETRQWWKFCDGTAWINTSIHYGTGSNDPCPL